MTNSAYFSPAFCFFLESADVAFDPLFGFIVVREFLLVSFEGWGVIVAAAVYVFSRVMDVEHFVEEDVLDHVFWDGEGIERTADRDVIMRCIMMAENAECFSG